MFFIDPDGSVSLTRLLLSPGCSIDVIARSWGNFLGESLKDTLAWVDSRLQLRCILNFVPEGGEQKQFIESLEKHGWYFRIHRELSSADTIIVDSEYVVISVDSSNESNDHLSVHYSEDQDFCSRAQQHFNYLWENSVEVILEDLFASAILPFQQQILTVSTQYWNSLLFELNANPQNLYSVHPRKFEELIAELLTRRGFSVQLTPETRDGGRDILALNRNNLGEHLYLVECKRYAPDRPIDVSLVRALYGVVEAERASAGLLVTTSYFTKDAIKFRDTIRHRMTLKNYDSLVDWIREEFRG